MTARSDIGRVASDTAAGFADYSAVLLKHSVSWGDVIVPAGSRGIVVHRHSDGVGYEVEFERPVQAVLSLVWGDLSNP